MSCDALTSTTTTSIDLCHVSDGIGDVSTPSGVSAQPANESELCTNST